MNDELRARIVAAFGSGSAQEVATMIGPPANRNIVAGVWYRRGLHRVRTRKHVKVRCDEKIIAPGVFAPNWHGGIGPKAGVQKVGHGCRFIEGNPAGEATVYCDAPRISAEHSYCPKHDYICHSHAPLSKLTVRYK